MVDREHLESEAAFYRELQNIRSEVGECENRIAILNARKLWTSQEVARLQSQVDKSSKSVHVIDSKIKDAKLSFRSSDGDIVNAPRQIKMNSNEISSLRLAIDREKYFRNELDKSEKVYDSENNLDVLQVHKVNFMRKYSTPAVNKDKCSLDSTKFKRTRGETILRILALYISQNESEINLNRLARFCHGLSE